MKSDVKKLDTASASLSSLQALYDQAKKETEDYKRHAEDAENWSERYLQERDDLAAQLQTVQDELEEMKRYKKDLLETRAAVMAKSEENTQLQEKLRKVTEQKDKYYSSYTKMNSNAQEITTLSQKMPYKKLLDENTELQKKVTILSKELEGRTKELEGRANWPDIKDLEKNYQELQKYLNDLLASRNLDKTKLKELEDENEMLKQKNIQIQKDVLNTTESRKQEETELKQLRQENERLKRENGQLKQDNENKKEDLVQDLLQQLEEKEQQLNKQSEELRSFKANSISSLNSQMSKMSVSNSNSNTKALNANSNSNRDIYWNPSPQKQREFAQAIAAEWRMVGAYLGIHSIDIINQLPNGYTSMQGAEVLVQEIIKRDMTITHITSALEEAGFCSAIKTLK